MAGDLPLPAELRAAVDGPGAGLVPLVVGPVLVAGEDVVGGDVHQVGAHPGAGGGQVSNPEGVDEHGPGRVGLAAVDVGPGGAVHDRRRGGGGDGVLHRVTVGQVAGRPVEGHDVVVGQVGRHLRADLPAGAGDHDAHGRSGPRHGSAQQAGWAGPPDGAGAPDDAPPLDGAAGGAVVVVGAGAAA